MQRAQLRRKSTVSEKDGGLDSWFYEIPGRASFESFAVFACPPFSMVPNGFLALFRSSAVLFRSRESGPGLAQVGDLDRISGILGRYSGDGDILFQYKWGMWKQSNFLEIGNFAARNDWELKRNIGYIRYESYNSSVT